ncbi:hypothetical protein H4R35_003070 [Dimargaris xerosporica]|nr:hypothetical protein H4R35_003070 [Dimargaris xerosporica]
MQDAIAITAGAVVCADTDIRGQVTVGTFQGSMDGRYNPAQDSVLNLLSRLLRFAGKLHHCENRRQSTPMIIGHFNTFEVASEFYGAKAGDHNTIEAREPNEKLSDYMVIYGALNQHRKLVNDDQAQVQLFTKHLKYLQDMLPRYNHVRKPTVA